MVVLAEGSFRPLESKTANQAIRYLPGEVAGVIDSTQAGRTAQQVLGFGGGIPVVENLESSMPARPNTLLIGIAPTGGRLPAEWRPVIMDAIGRGLNVISGLHTYLADDPEIASLAARQGVTLTDLRKVPPEYEAVSRGLWKGRKAKTILTVGTDCNVGKMTASWELHRECRRRGLRSAFVATGQTGILLSGGGVAVDSVLSDYIAGAIELEIEKAAAAGADFIQVEGQGSVTHQGYSGVALGLLHGTMPDAMILVHHPARHTDDYDFDIDDLKRSIRLHESLIAPFKECRVSGIAVNAAMMTESQTAAALEAIGADTGLPAVNVLTPGISRLADAVLRTWEG